MVQNTCTKRILVIVIGLSTVGALLRAITH